MSSPSPKWPVATIYQPAGGQIVDAAGESWASPRGSPEWSRRFVTAKDEKPEALALLGGGDRVAWSRLRSGKAALFFCAAGDRPHRHH